jgi:excisionase family DNA binding protein
MNGTQKSTTRQTAFSKTNLEHSQRPTFITIKEAANMLGLAPDTVHHGRAGTNKLSRVRFGRSVRMIREQVDAYIQERLKASQLNSIN